MAVDAGALARLFTHFADREVTGDPLYVALCRHVAAQPDLLALMQHAPPTQRVPNLLLAAVHERVLAGVSHDLRAYFPSAGGTRAPDAALPALFDFGSSAGLNLGVDGYRYDYGAFALGAAAADGVPVIDCHWI